MSQQGCELNGLPAHLRSLSTQQVMEKLVQLSQWHNDIRQKLKNLLKNRSEVQHSYLTMVVADFKKSITELKYHPAFSQELKNAFQNFVTVCERDLANIKPNQQKVTYSILAEPNERNSSPADLNPKRIIDDFKQFATRTGCMWVEQNNGITIAKNLEQLRVTPHSTGIHLQGSNTLGIAMLEQWCVKNHWEKHDLKLTIRIPHNITANSPEAKAVMQTFKEYTRNGFYVQDFQIDYFKAASGLCEQAFNELKSLYYRLQDETARACLACH